jgi:hypothetical protein
VFDAVAVVDAAVAVVDAADAVGVDMDMNMDVLISMLSTFIQMLLRVC